ncbi:MAG: hypothetical protein ACOYN8_00460 [Pseudanabaena sp.]|jgi:hypothetical protein
MLSIDIRNKKTLEIVEKLLVYPKFKSENDRRGIAASVISKVILALEDEEEILAISDFIRTQADTDKDLKIRELENELKRLRTELKKTR